LPGCGRERLDGKKELIAFQNGYRESEEPWVELPSRP